MNFDFHSTEHFLFAQIMLPTENSFAFFLSFRKNRNGMFYQMFYVHEYFLFIRHIYITLWSEFRFRCTFISTNLISIFNINITDEKKGKIVTSYWRFPIILFPTWAWNDIIHAFKSRFAETPIRSVEVSIDSLDLTVVERLENTTKRSWKIFLLNKSDRI